MERTGTGYGHMECHVHCPFKSCFFLKWMPTQWLFNAREMGTFIDAYCTPPLKKNLEFAPTVLHLLIKI